MKVLLIGSGGREHSLALKISQSSKLTKLYIAPGNPGTLSLGENISLKITDSQGLLKFAKEQNIDLTVVGPEIPLANGLVDLFLQNNLKIIGPTQKGAQLESSKSWAKNFYKKYNIPTADYEIFNTYDKALNYIIRKNNYPIVIKADGLAAGKGVIIASSLVEAKVALSKCFLERVFSDAGKVVVIEDFLKGEEASVLAFTDGKTVLPMSSAQDHKAIFDGDKGPNTGGMGAYSPAPIVTKVVEEKVYKNIFQPLIKGLQKEGIVYKGILYAGLMILNEEPYVIEFNVRFGDPETQVVLPRLQNDILDIFQALIEDRLDQIKLEWLSQVAICIVLASGGYPDSYEKNIPIIIDQGYFTKKNLQLIHAGTKVNNKNNLLTDGGRVFGVVGLATNLKEAISKTYSAVDKVEFKNKYFRTDIGKKALN